jgi:hypothetical protein
MPAVLFVNDLTGSNFDPWRLGPYLGVVEEPE